MKRALWIRYVTAVEIAALPCKDGIVLNGDPEEHDALVTRIVESAREAYTKTPYMSYKLRDPKSCLGEALLSSKRPRGLRNSRPAIVASIALEVLVILP